MNCWGLNASVSFSPITALEDTKRLAAAIGAPYSEPKTLKILNTFEECFKGAAVVWRTTDRAGDTLNFRAYLRRQMDTISLAINAGLIEPGDPLVRLLGSWASLYNGDTEQWCDFDPNAGLAKTWVNLRGRRPVEDILHAPGVPAAVRAHGTKFHDLGLAHVTFVAVDYRGGTINLYFVTASPLCQPRAAQYTKLVGCPPPTQQEYRDMLQFLNPQDFTFAVTFDYQSGQIMRVAFYALDLPWLSRMPVMDSRLVTFFASAPSYDRRQTRIVAWSYGLGGSKYMKAESSYVGELATLGTLRKEVDAPL